MDINELPKLPSFKFSLYKYFYPTRRIINIFITTQTYYKLMSCSQTTSIPSSLIIKFPGNFGFLRWKSSFTTRSRQYKLINFPYPSLRSPLNSTRKKNSINKTEITHISTFLFGKQLTHNFPLSTKNSLCCCESFCKNQC